MANQLCDVLSCGISLPRRAAEGVCMLYAAPGSRPFTRNFLVKDSIGCQLRPRASSELVGCKAAGPAAGSRARAPSDTELLKEVQHRIDKSDGGDALSLEEQSEINEMILQLASVGQDQQPRPLANDDLFGNFTVSYSSTERAATQKQQPAGGGFRSGLAKRLFVTTGLWQSVIQPDIVTNRVDFLLLGCLHGSVGLRGRLKPVSDDQATVEVNFDPPKLRIGKVIDLCIGPKSSVVLKTVYLTPTVRLGQGSRGSLFVFKKNAAADAAGLQEVGLGRTTAAGWLALAAPFVGLCAAALNLWKASVAGRVAAILPAVAALLLGQAAVSSALLQRQESS